MKFRLAGDWLRLKRTVRKLDHEALGDIFKALITGANNIRNRAISSMQNTTRGTRTYKRGKKTHTSSAPGHPPAVDRGGLVGNILADVRGNTEVEVGALKKIKYAGFLEKGTKRMEARPWLEPAFEEEKENIESSINRVISNIIGRGM